MLERIDDLCVAPDSPLLEVMRAIEEGAVEIALMVDAERRLLGTITDGDVRREVLRRGSLQSVARLVATTDFLSVRVGTSREEVLQLMTSRWIKQIPVVDEAGRLVGLYHLHRLMQAGERPNIAVVMAGGRGTRMRPLTNLIPKPMVPLGDRPLLERLISLLVAHGIRRVFLAINYLGQMIEDHFGDGSRLGCQIRYLREEKELGTGGALSLLDEKPHDSLLVMNGDLVTGLNVGRVFEFHEQRRLAMTVVVRREGFRVPFGVVHAEDMRVRAIEEKPTMEFTVNSGIYVVSPGVLDRIPRDTLFPMTSLVKLCLDAGETVGAYHMDEHWMDVGSDEH